MIYILDFNFKKLNNHCPLIKIVISAILHADDTEVQTAVHELVFDNPQREETYDALLTTAMGCYDELQLLTYKTLRPLYLNGYDIIDVKPFGADTAIYLEQICGNATDDYYI